MKILKVDKKNSQISKELAISRKTKIEGIAKRVDRLIKMSNINSMNNTHGITYCIANLF